MALDGELLSFYVIAKLMWEAIFVLFVLNKLRKGFLIYYAKNTFTSQLLDYLYLLENNGNQFISINTLTF